ncbi:glycosyltransferase family 2 protein [Parabacteroides distasonis]|uniref:glycosyltransferase family 2 protein n=1 Tax=Parabacteroides distasonis TaxID=823 RepID=UPI00189F0763|nr:glycosyltransferase [Parabacteroides distasonis]MDB9153001.1 glycosyltransferase [Parabacteroides distasonis]MDB9157674.1 glycosyltransferase [Parabacteroides distasonis]MDB9166539.1 glycosyltransferase [Parabacteroides distasonis]MDB9170958.1 glycosyltransferase [Parabacteroides distasonis]MDB9192728.1 glycosyltransferase [Parabacteroides distasonis]
MSVNNINVIPPQVEGLFDGDTDLRPVKVTIRCITYNHEPYIRQALEGFVMQETNFRFEAIVHDDASTDGTAGIIQEYAEKYPDIIKPILETENQYSKGDGSLGRIMNAAMRGKYIALCEGDDYWTDPFKLQKQVDYLELNPDYGACYARTVYLYQQNRKFSSKPFGGPWVNFYDLLIRPYFVPTATLMFRRKIYNDYVKEINPYCRNWKMGDLPISLYIFSKCKIKFFSETMSVYRVLNNSMCHFNSFEAKNKFINSAYDVKRFFANYNNFDNSIEKRIDDAELFELLNSTLRYDYVLCKEYLSKINMKSNIKYWLYRLILMNSIVYRLFLFFLK